LIAAWAIPAFYKTTFSVGEAARNRRECGRLSVRNDATACTDMAGSVGNDLAMAKSLPAECRTGVSGAPDLRMANSVRSELESSARNGLPSAGKAKDGVHAPPASRSFPRLIT